jgi:hypothetical protein
MTVMAYPRALQPKKPTTASTTRRPMTYPCRTGRRLDDESCVKTGSVMKAARVCEIPAAAIGPAAPAEADVDTDIAQSAPQDGSRASRDDAAQLGTIVCERLYERLDFNADSSAECLSRSLL